GDADTLTAPMIATTSSASCFRLCMVTLLWPDILAEQAPKPSACSLLGQLPGRRLPSQDPIRDRATERFVEGGRHNRRPAPAPDGADIGAQRSAFPGRQAGADMFQDQHVRIERQDPP